MNRRLKLGFLVIIAVASAALGQLPPNDREPIVDPDLQPAQFWGTPSAPRGRGYWNGQLTSVRGPIAPAAAPAPAEARTFAGLPPQPPTPTVQLTVLVPRDHPPGQDTPCTIKAANTTGADAHRVAVRVGELDGATVVAADPKPQDGDGLTWTYKVLKPNETQTIALKLRPKPGTASVSVKAFVSFEHGQSVKTSLSEPKLTVQTELPRQQSAEEPVPVRVSIRNGGRVPIVGAKLTQTINDGFEFHKEIAGGEPTRQPHQRLWTVGTIQPGETKVLQYLVTATKGRALQVLSVVDAEGKVQANDTAEAKLLDAGLRIRLSGDGKVTGEQSAVYEATVTNSGTMPLANIQVSGNVPEDCRLTKMTRGGKEYRGQVIWTIPKLAVGESQSVRWGLQSSNGGRRQIRAAASNGRGLEDTASAETVFQGVAILNWQSSFDRDTVAIDTQGVLTVVVRNSGTDTATNVRLNATLPKGLANLVQASPKFQLTGEKLDFDALAIPAGKSETFTVTFKGEQFGRAYFGVRLSADSLGDRPLSAEKYVEIVRK